MSFPPDISLVCWLDPLGPEEAFHGPLGAQDNSFTLQRFALECKDAEELRQESLMLVPVPQGWEMAGSVRAGAAELGSAKCIGRAPWPSEGDQISV